MKKSLVVLLPFLLIGFVAKAQGPADTIAYSISPTCVNGDILLLANDSTAWASLRWQLNGVDIPGAVTPHYTATQSGTYRVVANAAPAGPDVFYPGLAVTIKPTASFNFAPSGQCSNTPVSFTSTSTGSNLSYAWNFGDPNSGVINTASVNNPTHTFAGATGTGTQNFTVSLTVTDNNGCSATATSTVTTRQLPVVALVGPNPTVFNGKTYFTTCSAGASSASMDFANDGSTSPGTAYKIVWGDGSPDFNQSSFSSIVSHTYNVGTTPLNYTVTGANGCSNTTTYFIFIGSNPQIGIDNPGNTSICSGSSLTFPIRFTPAPGTVYTAMFNDGTAPFTFDPDTLTSQSITHTFNNSSCGTTSQASQTYPNSFAASITATNPCAQSSGTVVPIYVSDKPQAALAAAHDTACVNIPITLNNLSPANKSVSSNGVCTNGKFIWTISGTQGTDWNVAGRLGNNPGTTNTDLWTPGDQTISITFLRPGTYVVTLKLANNSCGADSLSDTICVNAVPTASFTIDNAIDCSPVNVTTTNNSPAPNCGNNKYQWSVSYTSLAGCLPNSANYAFTNGTNAGSVNPQFQFVNPGTYTISLVTTSPGGCSSTPVTQSVTVKGKPTVGTISTAISICQGDKITPTTTTNNCGVTNGISFLWTFNTGNPASSTSAAPGNVFFNTPGTQTISVAVTNECGTTLVDTPITVKPTPDVTVPANLSLCAGTSTGALNFSSTLSGTSFHWTNDHISIGLAASGNGNINSFTVTNTGNAPVTATITVTPSNNGCTGTPISFTITVNPVPAAPSVTSPVTYCQNATASALDATPSTGNSLNWYTVPTGGVPSSTAPVPSTATAGSTTWYVSQYNTSTLCESNRTSIVVTVNASPVIAVGTVNNTTSCGSATGSITLTGLTANTSYRVDYTKDGTAVTVNRASNGSGVITLLNLSSGTYANITVTLAGCPSNIVGPVTISDPSAPAVPSVSSNAPICSGNTLTLNSSSTTPGVLSYTWTGPNGFTSNQQNTSIANATTAASGTYSVTAGLNGCSSAAATVSVTVNQTPATPSVSSNSPICSGNDVTLTASTTTAGAINYTWTGPGSYTSTTQNPTITNADATASGTYTVTAALGGCTSLQASTSVTVNTTPVISGSNSSDPTNCSTATGSIVLNGLANGSYTVKYTRNGSVTTLNNITASGGNITIPNLSAGVYSNVFVVLNGCTSNAVGPFSLTDPNPPATPTINSINPVCSGNTLNLNSSSTTAGVTYTWSGPNGFTSTQQSPSIPNVTVAAGGVYSVTATKASCTSAAGTVSVTVNPTPATPVLSSNSPVCTGNTLTITTTNYTGVTYAWAGPNGFSTTDPSVSIPSVTTAQAGSYGLIVTATTGNCPSATGTSSVTINPTPVISGGTPHDPTVCGSTTGSIVLSGLSAGSYTVQYSANGHPVTVSNVSASGGTITLSGLTAGIYDNISVTLAGCPSNTVGPFTLADPNPPATPVISPINPICSGNTLNLNSSSTTSGVAYSWTGPNGFTSNLQNPVISNATTARSGAYSVTATLSGCVSAAGTVAVTVDSTPAKPSVSSNSPLCYGSTVQLSSTITFSGALTYAWTGPNSFTSSAANPVIANADENASGTYSLTITATAGSCASQPATTAVLVRPLLTQAVVSGPDSVFVCGFAPPANASQSLTANLNSSRSFETGQWTIISQPAGGTGSFANSTQPSTTFTYAKSGNYALQWAITNDLSCPSTKDTVVFAVVDKPAISQNVSASSTNVCAGNPVTIQVPANAVTGQIRYWQFKRPYTAAVWQDTLVTNPSITFNSVTDTFLVRVVVIAADQTHCSGDTAFSQVLINVAPPSYPGVSAGATTVCTGSNSGTITLTGNIGVPVSWQSSVDGSNFNNIPSSAIQNYHYTNLTVTTWFRAAVKSGNCDTVFSNTTKVTVYPTVTPANAGPDVQLCGNSTYQLAANQPGSLESGIWAFASGSPTASITDPSNANTTLTNLVPNTTYQLVWTLSNGICPASQDAVVIRNYLPLTNTIDMATLTVCNGVSVQAAGDLPAGGNPPYQYQWQVLQGTNNWVNIPGATSQNYTFIADTTVTIRRQVTANPCSNVSLAKTINVQPPIGNNTISANAATCINTSPGVLTGSVPTGADGNYFYQWQVLLGTVWTDITGATQKDYTVPVLTVTTQYRRLVTSALCSGSQGLYSAAFTVTVHPDASAQWAVTKDTSCAPFHIDNNIVRPVSLPQQNGSYNWYANGIFYGSSPTSNPGYTLTNPADSVTIKMVAVSLYGCKNDSIEQQFYTIPAVLTSFTMSTNGGCGPLTVALNNTTPNQGFFTYYWNFGNNTSSSLAQPGSIVLAPNPNFGDTVYTITLTASSACESISQSKTVTVASKPKAIFTPGKTTGCSPLTINFTNSSRGNGVTYSWDFGDGNTLTTATPDAQTHTFYTSVQDTFIVKLIATNQCGSDTAMYNIVVSPNLVHLNFAVNGNEEQGCKQHTVHFINTSSGATNFAWNFGDGNTLSTTKNLDTVVHTYLQAGNFTVVLFATNGCSDTSTTQMIQVVNPPIANFTTAPLAACIGDTVHFFNQSDSATSLTWIFRDGYTSSLTNPVHAYTAPGVYNVQLMAFRQYNSGLSCADSITKAISIVAKMQGIFAVTDSISNCVPFTAVFTNQDTPSSLTVWSFGINSADTGDVVTHTFTQTGTYLVKMDALSPGGCTYEATKNIVVRGPSGSLQYDHGIICNTTPVRFTVSASGTDSVRWDFGDGNTLTTTATIVYHSYTQAGKYLPSATLVSSLKNGCSVLLQGTDTIQIDFVKAGFRYATQSGCDSVTISFIDTSRHYAAITNWQWKFGDGNTSSLQNPQHSYQLSNTWQTQLIVTSASGCSDTATTPIVIKVNNRPHNNISAVAQGCVGQPVTYTAQVVSTDNVTLNYWSFSNGVQLNGSPVANIYATPGVYTATLVSGTAFGCTDTAIKSITINPTPSVTVSPDQLICKGQSLQLGAVSTAPITWSPLNNTLSCTSCTNPVATPATTTQYIATATNSFGCSSADSVTITVAQPIHLVASPNDTICIGSSAQLTVTGATTYVWSPAATLTGANTATPVATPVLTTQYQVIGFDAHHCFEDTATVIVAVGQYPTVDLGADKVVATGTLLPLNYASTNGPLTAWTWTPTDNLSCSNCAVPVATIKKDVCYTLEAANLYHCKARDTICIKVFCENTQVFIPNVFTPDHDGKNDILMVRGSGIKTVKSFRIFNRWGQVVFERSNVTPNDPSQGWDGRINGIPAPPDVFIYTCEVVCDNDITYTYKGNVAIIK